LLAWVNQPQILARLRDPDAILARWVSLDGSGVDTPSGGAASYADRVAEIKESIYVIYQVLRDNHVV
jgi:hypothetical protein